jgi:hypothetical protein
MWRFQSSWFNCREMDRSPERSLDVHLNTRAMGPFLWHAYLTRDRKAIDLLEKWGESWRQAQSQTAHGKPAGRFPPAMEWASGSYLIRSADWAKPQAEWDYFQWSRSAQDALVALMRALHDLTGDAKWSAAADAGSDGGATGLLPEGDDERLALMARLGAETERRLSMNFDMYTSEALWTDRVYYPLPEPYRHALFGGEAPRGDRYPDFAVTWGAADGEVARAVLQSSPDTMRLALYNFESGPVELPLRLWRLRPGTYRIEGLPSGPLRFRAETLPKEIRLAVPSRREVRVVIAFENR